MPRSTTPPVAPHAVAAPSYSYVELSAAPEAHTSAALAEEVALALSFNGINHSVMMVTPNDVADFIRGFSLSSALVPSIDDIYDIQLQPAASSINAEVTISNRAFWAMKQQRRTLAGTSGCGLCGVEALDQALPEIVSLSPSALPPAEHLHGLRSRIEQAQTLARDSGAVHAALYVDAHGEIALCREDIGRHNALDKLIGALHSQALARNKGFAVVTSRCSLELIHKALRAGIGTLVSLSAPTSLSVQWARQHQLNLIHLPKHSAPRVYSPQALGVAQP
jgi:FdhD protein